MQLRRNYYTMNPEVRVRELEADAADHHNAGFNIFAALASQEAAIWRAKIRRVSP